MSEAAAIAAHPAAAAGVSPSAGGERRPRGIDLYAEGNSFAAPDGPRGAIEGLFGADGIGFRDLLDIVNPLHHLPVVGTLYRAITGDALAPGARLLGGTLFGGIGGFVVSLVNAVVENETGSDLGDKALALFRDEAGPHRTLADAAPPTRPATREAVAQAPPDPKPERRSFPIYAGPPASVSATGGRMTESTGKTEAVPAALALAGAETAPLTGPDDLAPDVAVLMRDALDKYEALMKSRVGPSISGDF